MLLYQKESLLQAFNPAKPVIALVRNAALWRQLTWRQVEMPHRGSILGVTWSFFNPLLVFAVYAFVFIAVFKGRYGVIPGETNVDYALGLLLGLTVLQLFQEVLLTAPFAVLQNPNYVKKVVFPLEILPAAIFGAAFFRFSVCLLLVSTAIVLFGPSLTIQAFWLIPIILSLCLLALGIGWLMAALGVFLRDIAPFTQALSLLLMFSSAVFYSLKQIPQSFSFLRFNPLLIAVESSRDALLWGLAPEAWRLWYLGATGVLVWIFGYAVFHLLRGAFSDVL